MHSRSRSRSFLNLALALGLVATAASPFIATAAAQDDEETPLGEQMEELQSGLRRLRKLVTKPDEKEATLEILRAMQGHGIQAFALGPEPPETLPAAEHAEWSVNFRRQILKVVDQLLVVELAVSEGRTEDAKSAYKELGQLKNAGHDTYQPD
ncbi:MAG: hypothetical protein E2O39_01650 [Planctomycetota bacterium]|nr:MAG: hypothetical protein E2O39_01650 [Planctomycetota bacterium]